MPGDGLFPAIGLHSEGEEVKINLDAEWEHKDVILMSIDNCEEEWSRLHEVRINGMVRVIHTKRLQKRTRNFPLMFLNGDSYVNHRCIKLTAPNYLQ